MKSAKFFGPTEIQAEAVSLALRGLDILGAAKTGSGKTLAFLIPVNEETQGGPRKKVYLKWKGPCMGVTIFMETIWPAEIDRVCETKEQNDASNFPNWTYVQKSFVSALWAAKICVEELFREGFQK